MSDFHGPLDAAEVREEILDGARRLFLAFSATPLLIADRGAPVLIRSQREPPLLLVRNGFVLRHQDLPDGQRAVLDVLIPGDVIGLDHLVMARPTGEFVAARLSYQALPAAAVRKLMKEHPNVSLHLFALLAEVELRIERLTTTIMRFEAHGRLVAFILGIYQRLRRRGLLNRLSFNLPLTQEQIADHLGMTLVHMNRTLRRLREDPPHRESGCQQDADDATLVAAARFQADRGDRTSRQSSDKISPARRVIGDTKTAAAGSDRYVQTVDRDIDPDIVRFTHLRTPSLLMRARAWQLFGYGRYGWSAKLTHGLTAETRTGFQPWQGPARNRAPVTPKYDAVPTYKTRREQPFAERQSFGRSRPRSTRACLSHSLARSAGLCGRCRRGEGHAGCGNL